MKEFALLFRMDLTTEEAQPSEEQMSIYMHDWMQWMDGMAENGELAEGGNHFSKEGRLIRPKNKILNTPHVAENNSVAGYILIYAKDMEAATKIALRCPILKGENTSVEIREVESPEGLE